MADQPRPYDRHQDRDLGHSVLRDHHVQADAHTGLTDHGRVVVPPDEHPERHEHTDVSVRGITYTAVAIVSVMCVALVFVFVIQRAFLRAQEDDNLRARRTALEPARQFPPDEVPKLQGLPGYHPETPASDMALLRARNTRELTSYGHKPDGTAYIPVSRAMELALEQNLFPARPEAASGESSATRQSAGTGDNAGNRPAQQPSDPGQRAGQGALQTPRQAVPPKGGSDGSH